MPPDDSVASTTARDSSGSRMSQRSAFAKNRTLLQSKPAVFGGWLVTFLAVVVGWVFFKAGDHGLYRAGATRGEFDVARAGLHREPPRGIYK